MGYYSGSDAAENVRGTYIDDSIYLYGGNDAAQGSFGNDWIYGGDGNDRLFGGAQGDYLYGEAGVDRLRGEGGNDVLTGGAGGDVLDGGTGDDRFMIEGRAEMRGDQVYGGTGIDTLVLDLSDATAFRFAAPDSIDVSSFGGMTFRDVERYEIEGSARGDVVTGWLLGDRLDGNGGNDRLSGYFGDDSLDGGDGNDALIGGGGHDFLLAGDGADQVRGGFGNDGLYGGAGSDRLDGESGDDNLEGGAGADALTGGFGDDTLGADSFTDSGTERDALSGGGGNDLLRIGIGDVAYGQAGSDRLDAYFAESATNETFILRQAAHTFANGARVSGFEALTYTGGSGVDQITGGRFADDLTGGGGNDRLNGAAGGDDLDGGDGNDQLNGATGNDYLEGGRGNDRLTGGGGNDTLSHTSGNDRLFGQGGADSFEIGWDEASDLPYRVAINGGAGRDTVDFTSITLGAVVDLGNQALNDGLAFGKTLVGIEVLNGTSLDDSFAGTSGGDSFYGNGGDDVLSGRAGSDRLVGGGGADQLADGAGADVFDFTDYGSGWMGDTVSDFTRGQDRLAFELSDLGWRSEAGVRLVSGADPEPVGGAANLLFDSSTGRLWLDADGANDTYGPELLVTLTGVRALAESDFLFI